MSATFLSQTDELIHRCKSSQKARTAAQASCFHSIAIFLSSAALLVAGSAHASLIDLGQGLVYDSGLDDTWVQDANLAASNTFGVTGIDPDGTMSWDTAQQWIAAMNAHKYLGYSDWRQPLMGPANSLYFNHDFARDGSTDYGFNVSAPGSVFAGGRSNEIANLFYNSLANLAYYDTAGAAQAGYGLINTGPFINFQGGGNHAYWSASDYPTGSVPYASSTDPIAPGFLTYNGGQNAFPKDAHFWVLVVRDGSIPSVPEPQTYVLMLAGLGVMYAARRLSQ